MRQIVITCCCLFSLTICWAQSTLPYHGARSAGMSLASTTIADEYSLYNNIGGISQVEKSTVLAGYQNRYSIHSFQTVSAGFIYPAKGFHFGIAFLHFGDDLYNQQRIRTVIGNRIQQVSLGLAIDYDQVRIETIGVAQALSFGFGGIAEILPFLHCGFYISNITQASLTTEPSTPLPTIFSAGLSFIPTTELLVILEIKKDLGFDELLKCGLEYRLISAVAIRTGIQPTRRVSSFGLGFRSNKLNIDYAFSPDLQLGHSHDFSLFYQMR